jgi:small-conductance mechanosensitive channel
MLGLAVNIIDHSFFEEIGLFFSDFCRREHWQSLLHSLYEACFGNLFVTVLGMSLLLLGWISYQRLLWFADRMVKRANRDQTISSRDTFRLMLASSLASVLAWTPWGLVGCWLMLIAGRIEFSDFYFSMGLAVVSVFLLGCCYRLVQEFLSHGGLSETLYGFKHSNARYLLTRIQSTVFLITPLISLIVLAASYQQGRWQDSVGRFAFLLTLALGFSQFHRLLWPGSKFYQRLENDTATREAGWLRHRFLIYLLGCTLFFWLTGLTLSGWLTAAKAISINVSLTILLGTLLFGLHTLMRKRAQEWIRRLHLIDELGRSPDSPATARSNLVQDFVSRNSQTAYRGIDFLSVMLFLAGSVWIWRNWIELPPELLNFRIGGLALSSFVTGLKLAAIGGATYYCAKELPDFLLWCFRYQTGIEVQNSRLASRILGGVIVGLGIFSSLRILELPLPEIPWAGSLLLAGLLFASRQFFSDAAAGIMILLDSRIVPGDCVELDQCWGRVEQVNWLSTLIEDNQGSRWFIPNSQIVSQKVAKTRDEQTTPLLIEVAIPRNADAYQAQAIMQLVAEKDPAVVSEPAPHIRFKGFRRQELRFEIRLLVQAQADPGQTRNRIEEKLAIEFERHKIHESSVINLAEWDRNSVWDSSARRSLDDQFFPEDRVG